MSVSTIGNSPEAVVDVENGAEISSLQAVGDDDFIDFHESTPTLQLSEHQEPHVNTVEESQVLPVVEDLAALIEPQEPLTVPTQFPFFPFLPRNVQEHITSFVERPQRLRVVCKAFRDAIVVNSIVIQIQRIKDHPEAVKALQLAEIIDLNRYSEQDLLCSAEHLQVTIAQMLEAFFTRLVPSVTPLSVFEMIANPQMLASRIYTVYFNQITEVMFIMSPSFSPAGEFASQLLQAHNSQSQTVTTAQTSNSPASESTPMENNSSPAEDEVISSERAVTVAMEWAHAVHDLCAIGVIPSFKATITDGTYQSPQHTWLPKAFLHQLTPIPISLFGVIETVGPNK